MVKQITCMLVDDNRIDNLTLQAFLENHPEFEITGIYQSPELALAAAKKLAPDVLFLDIDMPNMSGLALRKQLLHVPGCVFISTLPDHALESFELAPLDYIIKPYSTERINQTVNRLKDYFTLLQRSAMLSHTLGADTIFVKDGTSHVKLQLHEVLYLEAFNNYTAIVTAGKKYLILSAISTLLQGKSFNRFIRIHRSFAVQKNYITRISVGEVLLTENISLPVGRTYKEVLNNLRS